MTGRSIIETENSIIADLPLRVGPDERQGVLVEELALGRGEVAEDPLGGLAVQLQHELDNDAVVTGSSSIQTGNSIIANL